MRATDPSVSSPAREPRHHRYPLPKYPHVNSDISLSNQGFWLDIWGEQEYYITLILSALLKNEEASSKVN